MWQIKNLLRKSITNEPEAQLELTFPAQFSWSADLVVEKCRYWIILRGIVIIIIRDSSKALRVRADAQITLFEFAIPSV